MNRLNKIIALAAMATLGMTSSALATDRVAYPSPAVDGLPYSGAVRAGDTVYVGAVLGTVKNNGKAELVPGGVKAETRQAFAHVKTMLETAGSSMDRTVKCTVLLSNIKDFPGMNEVFREVFPKDPPTRSTIIVPEIPMGAAMEVECNALAGK